MLLIVEYISYQFDTRKSKSAIEYDEVWNPNECEQHEIVRAGI